MHAFVVGCSWVFNRDEIFASYFVAFKILAEMIYNAEIKFLWFDPGGGGGGEGYSFNFTTGVSR